MLGNAAEVASTFTRAEAEFYIPTGDINRCSHLVKLVFLLSILSGTANAQWGAVVAQPDTNRFINSQQDFGLIMPHQQVIVGLLDTTITSVGIGGGNAYKVIVGSLLDYEDNCVNYTIVNGVASCEGSYELWREMEKSTSWYQATRGDTTAMFPTNYAVTISTGKDSVNIWNRDTAELWMAFKQAGSNNDDANLSYLTAQNLTDIGLLDGKLYFGTNGGGIWYIDFLADQSIGWFASGQRWYEGNLHQRNDGKGNAASATLAIVNNNVIGVTAIRDPFGLKDALGRPKHWWAADMSVGSSNLSIYNPHTNAIYDRSNAVVTAGLNFSMNKKGWIAHTMDDAARDMTQILSPIFTQTADGFNMIPGMSISHGTGGAQIHRGW